MPIPSCSCTQKLSPNGLDCVECEDGQVADDDKSKCVAAPTCDGDDQIVGDKNNCF